MQLGGGTAPPLRTGVCHCIALHCRTLFPNSKSVLSRGVDRTSSRRESTSSVDGLPDGLGSWLRQCSHRSTHKTSWLALGTCLRAKENEDCVVQELSKAPEKLNEGNSNCRYRDRAHLKSMGCKRDRTQTISASGSRSFPEDSICRRRSRLLYLFITL